NLLSVIFFLVMSSSVVFAFWGPVQVNPHALDHDGLVQIGVVAALVIIGLAFFLSAIVMLGKNFALVAQVRDEGTLITSGPYALVRNPIYLGYYLLIIATPLAFGHLENLLTAVPIYFIGAGLRILGEEGVLRASYGAAYDAYAQRVKRLIPFIW